jgi:hypothetical protein
VGWEDDVSREIEEAKTKRLAKSRVWQAFTAYQKWTGHTGNAESFVDFVR